jgi:hypothetical protein
MYLCNQTEREKNYFRFHILTRLKNEEKLNRGLKLKGCFFLLSLYL